MKTILLFRSKYFVFITAAVVPMLLTTCNVISPILSKEFVFPLKVGNAWEYDWEMYNRDAVTQRRQGKETWTVISTQEQDTDTLYTVSIIDKNSQNIARSLSIRRSQNFIIIQKYVQIFNTEDSIPRYSSLYTNENDTLKTTESFLLETKYVNRVGVVFIGELTSRTSRNLSLSSYTLQP